MFTITVILYHVLLVLLLFYFLVFVPQPTVFLITLSLFAIFFNRFVCQPYIPPPSLHLLYFIYAKVQVLILPLSPYSFLIFRPHFIYIFKLYYYTGHFLSLPFQLRCTVKLCFLPLQDFHSYKKVARGILPLIPIRGRGKLPQHSTSFEICCQKRLLFLGVT